MDKLFIFAVGVSLGASLVHIGIPISGVLVGCWTVFFLTAVWERK